MRGADWPRDFSDLSRFSSEYRRANDIAPPSDSRSRVGSDHLAGLQSERFGNRLPTHCAWFELGDMGEAVNQIGVGAEHRLPFVRFRQD